MLVPPLPVEDAELLEVGVVAGVRGTHAKTHKSEVVHSGGLLWLRLNNAACC